MRQERRMMSPFFVAIVSAGPIVGFEIGHTLPQYYYIGLRRSHWNDPPKAT